MEEELLTVLLSDAAVSAATGGRVAWVKRPQGDVLPAVVLNVIHDANGLTMQGPDGLWQGRVQADCYALTLVEVKAAARALISLLHGYRGGGFRLVEHVATRDSREGGTDEAEMPFRVSLDFMTHWRAI